MKSGGNWTIIAQLFCGIINNCWRSNAKYAANYEAVLYFLYTTCLEIINLCLVYGVEIDRRRNGWSCYWSKHATSYRSYTI